MRAAKYVLSSWADNLLALLRAMWSGVIFLRHHLAAVGFAEHAMDRRCGMVGIGDDDAIIPDCILYRSGNRVQGGAGALAHALGAIVGKRGR